MPQVEGPAAGEAAGLGGREGGGMGQGGSRPSGLQPGSAGQGRGEKASR